MQSIPFQFETQYGLFSDALILSDDEVAALTADQIEAMKQQRLSNWLTIFDPQPETPTETQSETPTETQDQ
jgi:hypothetical protein